MHTMATVWAACLKPIHPRSGGYAEQEAYSDDAYSSAYVEDYAGDEYYEQDTYDGAEGAWRSYTT